MIDINSKKGAFVFGRIIWVGEGRVAIENDEGVFSYRHEGDPPPIGAWVLGEARGDVLENPWVGEKPSAPFPVPSGDWLAFHRDGRRRIRFLKLRAQALQTLRAFFNKRGYLEVETPLRVPSPGLDLHLDPLATSDGMWLITSPEYQMKRLLSAGLPRIYQIARAFRRGEVGHLHEPEFTLVEWYRAFADSASLRGETAELIAELALALRGRLDLKIEAFGKSQEINLEPPWEELSVEEAFKRWAPLPLEEALKDESVFYRLWVESIEPHLGLKRPVFVVDWPASMASLAQLKPDRPDRADRFELYICGIELSNGFGELIDPIEQRRRLVRDQEERARRGLPVPPIDERFLKALEEGLPPCAGNALGFDRVLALLLGASSIAEVMAFESSRL
ncbi:MAG: EF-P lysine aminoacylase EpmA [Sandaracinaceae bacterium]|nr:EF-P lysine aminoacylase EpmA [Sandaracinaceae bacterium]